MSAARSVGLFARLRLWLRDSPWTPLVPKLLGWMGAFSALALVGSGVPAAWLPVATTSEAHLASVLVAAPPSTADPIVHEAPDGGAAPADAGAEDAAPGPSAITGDGRVILNLATEQDLRRLPGIGPTRAQKILDLRKRLGKFKKLEDLLRVKGIGRKALAKLRPHVLVDAPAPG